MVRTHSGSSPIRFDTSRILAYSTAIALGTLKTGERMPSVRELMARHDISLSTALQVLRYLEEQGSLEARPRVGYFVRAMSTGLPSFTPATTMAPGASMRLRTTSHILRIWPPSRTSVRAMMTGYPAGASCTWESSVANMSSPIMLTRVIASGPLPIRGGSSASRCIWWRASTG